MTTPYWADFTVGADLATLATPAQLSGISVATYKLNILANGQSNPDTFLIKPDEGLQAAGRGMTCRPCR
ncbi:MAG TPA: hypothetical protein VGP57_08780 [Actinoplanes sp.]|nr:hypothetical protein [Actinoplanes sp.]